MHLRWQSPICGFLRFPAGIFGFLRENLWFSVVSCALQTLEFPGEGVNLRKSAVFCENLRLGSLCHLSSVPLSAPTVLSFWEHGFCHGFLCEFFLWISNAIAAKVWALSDKENGRWKIGRAFGNAAGFSPPTPPQPLRPPSQRAPGMKQFYLEKRSWKNQAFNTEWNVQSRMFFFIPGPSLAAEKQGPGLKFSIENENFKPRMIRCALPLYFFANP